MITSTQNGKILVIGALGQIGQELTATLRSTYGVSRVIAADIRLPEHPDERSVRLDVLDRDALLQLIEEHQIEVIFNLAAILSAKGEQEPQLAWRINMEGLLNTLEAARIKQLHRIFWPSSIAVFGPGSPKVNTPQSAIMDPTTIYGISKLAGERWCVYYAEKYGVDVRSLRYPGLIGYKSLPGGGTTDYAVEIFHEAIQSNTYTSFLSAPTRLPMMYMPDAIRATLQLMEAPSSAIQVRSSYNIQGISFSPEEIGAAIQAHLPDFQLAYAPDFRQEIAESWPQLLEDDAAQRDWGWKAEYDLEKMVIDMLKHIHLQYDTQPIELS